MLQHVYAGARQESLDSGTSEVVDPSTGQVYDMAPVAGRADLDAAFCSAQQAFPGWRDRTPGERSRLLLRVADLLEERAELFVQAECRNTGKPVEAMRAEMPHVLDVIRFSAGASRVQEGMAGGEYAPGHTSYLRREPLGVVAQITPWNYPLHQVVANLLDNAVKYSSAGSEVRVSAEVDAARWAQQHCKKPIAGFIAGATAPPGRRMGHAGAIVGGEEDTAEAKKRILAECGIAVAETPSDMAKTLLERWGK